MSNIILSKEEEKELLKSRKEKEKANKKTNKKKRKHIQHTKILLDIFMCGFILIGICSIYVNYKNGMSLDSIFSNICDMLKYIIPSGCAKSVLETYLEKKTRLEYYAKGVNYENSEDENNI